MFKREYKSKIQTNTRRGFLKSSALSIGALLGSSIIGTSEAAIRNVGEPSKEKGEQRLSLEKLKAWENWGYGMFIHFGLSTFVGKEVPYGYDSPLEYNPDQLNVDQWIRIARDSGMSYAVLTAKHCSGHCLWPSKCTDYTVANSGNKTDVVRKFIEACKKYNIKPGLYYNCTDTHHKFGSRTLLDLKPTSVSNTYPKGNEPLAPFTTSMYQSFMTDQLTELLTQYGPIPEIWIDNPGILGSGYRTYLYRHLSDLQPDAMIMMANAMDDGSDFDVAAAWPSDLVPIKATLPPAGGHKKWREINGKTYYMPGEVCLPIGKDWFYVEGDKPRASE